MGLLSLFRGSLRKSSDLRRISLILGGEMPMTASELFASSASKELAEKELYDIVECDPGLRTIMTRHSAKRDALQKIYWALMRDGAGQWVRGHWVAASALTFGATLEFVLEQTNNGDKSGRGTWDETAFSLIDYFEKGKVGYVH